MADFSSFRAGIPMSGARALLASACAAIALVAVALHSPGHTTVDTSIQLHEAITGRITSWAPPFMSALLYWLGLGSVATAMFVALNTAATYGGMRLAIGCGREGRAAWWRVVLALAIVANPVVFAYVGIVWKDVLLASLVSLALGLSLSAWRAQGFARVILASLAIGVLIPIPFVRQQGLVLLPVFAVSPGLLIVDAGWKHVRTRRIAGALVVVAVVLGYLGVRALVESSFARNANGSIYSANGNDMSVGTHMIKLYDLVGIEVRTPDGPLSQAGADAASVAATEKLYSAERIDFLNGPAVDRAFANLRGERLDSAWRHSVSENPGAYLAHRGSAFAWLLGFHGVAKCLPFHVGTAGIPEYLQESGLREEQDARDASLYRALVPFVNTPLWRHWFYVAWGLLLGVVAWRRGRGTQRVLLPWIAGLALFTAGYFPTSIACDFRYLYTLVPCAGIISLALLFTSHQTISADLR